jgi:thiol-disulfide isomerase/thioredoxin
MNNLTRTIILIVAVAAIGGAITFLESMNVHHVSVVPAGGDVAVPTTEIATTTASGQTIIATSTTPASAIMHSAEYALNKTQYPAAKELVSPDGYINTGGQPITIGGLLGKKVILVDFWTYSCINCQRTIPYLKAWYKKYQGSGLVVIGVHTPEFGFEKILSNVQAAVTKFGITYPVALDSNYYTWDAYGNNYWPEEYLIDIDGLVREHNIGEGNYVETEQNIQELLKERAQTLGLPTSTIPTGLVNISEAIETNSPESYFDWSRNEYLGNGTPQQAGVQTFTAPAGNPPLNSYYLGGTWNIGDESAVNTTDGATITYTYDAKDVYMVASASPGVTISITRDGKPLTSDQGADVDANGNASIGASRLYDLIAQPSEEEHTITITVHGTGLNAFTLDFG